MSHKKRMQDLNRLSDSRKRVCCLQILHVFSIMEGFVCPELFSTIFLFNAFKEGPTLSGTFQAVVNDMGELTFKELPFNL